MRIGLIAPPFLKLPPAAYAGTERIVAALAVGLHERGHDVTVFASGDSELPCRIVPVVRRALWGEGASPDVGAFMELTVARAWEMSDAFDVIHSHVETAGFLMARHCATPVVTTLHRRLDTPGVADLIDRFRDIPLVAISKSQRRWHERANWVGTVHHGLDFSSTPTSNTAGDYLLFIGRVVPEKGLPEAIEVARRSGRPLVMAARVFESEHPGYFDRVVAPAIRDGVVDWRGEVRSTERDELMAGALATLMLGAWPEPFGLVAIESMATGTPVIARRAGGCTETVIHGVTGYLVDDVGEAVLAVSRVGHLARADIARRTRATFSADRMTAAYEQIYPDLITRPEGASSPGGATLRRASASTRARPIAAARPA